MSARSSTASGAIRPSVSAETLGCKVNRFESEYIVNQLKSNGWIPAGDLRQDIHLINTCTVTREADRHSRQAIRRAIRRHPQATIIVTGCYAEMHPEICAEIPGVDYVVPGSKKLQIPQLLADGISLERQPIPPVAATPVPAPLISGFESRTRANLQVQQGCDNGCTFCIIHQARGPSRSIPPTTVIRQVHNYVQQGFLEIVVCGIDLGSYGDDLINKKECTIDLSGLVSELAIHFPNIRFRLSSIDPAHITPQLVSVMANHVNICPHIHLSLQSASPIILKRMKRRYQPDVVYAAVEALRKARADLILSADLMAGFPTESDADFELTRMAIYDLNIAYPHVFAYSERDGTPAARIPNQVPPKVRKTRARLLREAGAAVRQQVLSNYVGQVASALLEGQVTRQGKQLVRARLANYLPVYLAYTPEMSGRMINLELTDLHDDGLLGKRLNGPASITNLLQNCDLHQSAP